MILREPDILQQINEIEDLFYEAPSLSNPPTRLTRQNHDVDQWSEKGNPAETLDTHEEQTHQGVGPQNFVVILDRTNPDLGFQIFFRDVVNGQESGDLLQLGPAIQFAGALLSQATRTDLLQGTTLNELEEKNVVPHIIDVKLGKQTLRFSEVDGVSATRWYEETFKKIMQSIYDEMYTETVNVRSKRSVLVSTILRALTRDGRVPHPYLGRRPESFEAAVALLNLIDTIAFSETLLQDQLADPSQVSTTNAMEVASSSHSMNLMQPSDQPISLIDHTNNTFPKTISQLSGLIQQLVRSQVDFAESNIFTRKFYGRKVSRLKKKLQSFKESHTSALIWPDIRNILRFEATTTLHLLNREMQQRYVSSFEAAADFYSPDRGYWHSSISELLFEAERAVSWHLVNSDATDKIDAPTLANVLLESFTSAEYYKGYELDEYIAHILSISAQEHNLYEDASNDQLAHKTSRLLHALICHLKERYTEGQEIVGDDKNIVELVIILSKIFCDTDDSYREFERDILPMQRDLDIILDDDDVLGYVQAFSKELNASYTGKRSPVHKPETRIMPKISA